MPAPSSRSASSAAGRTKSPPPLHNNHDCLRATDIHPSSSPFLRPQLDGDYTTTHTRSKHASGFARQQTHDSSLQHSLLCLSVYGLVVTKKNCIHRSTAL